MPDAFTPNLNLDLPEVGSSADTWGTKTNQNWTAVDALFAPTGASVVVRTNAAGNAAIAGADINGAAGTTRSINYLTANKLRWSESAGAIAESGSNVGSDWRLQRYDDTGALLGTSLAVSRATGVGTFEATPQVGANQIYHQGNLPAVIATVSEPVGTIKMFAGQGDPAGGNYLICDGRAISRTTFSVLFAVVNVNYGAGDGTSTFNIPDFRERSPVGLAATQSLIPQYDARVIGNKIGEGLHTLTAAELAAHTHPIIDPKHHHTVGAASQFMFQSGGGGMTGGVAGAAATTTTDATGITQAENNVGGGGAHNTVQPSLVVNFIIRVQ
jgi:microcystin-dependent protein